MKRHEEDEEEYVPTARGISDGVGVIYGHWNVKPPWTRAALRRGQQPKVLRKAVHQSCLGWSA